MYGIDCTGRRLAAILTALVLASLGGCQTTQQASLQKTASAMPPSAGDRAIIFNHGRGSSSDAYALSDASDTATVPDVLQRMVVDGWDIYILRRPVIVDREHENRKAIAAAVAELRTEGYTHVVLAGQSAGAWSAIDAAGSVDVHGVIAFSPANHGTGMSRDLNATRLYSLLRSVRPTRIALVHFEGDPYETSARPARARSIVEQRMPTLSINRPEGMSGHGAAYSRAFAAAYQRCLADFIDPEKTTPATHCTLQQTQAARTTGGGTATAAKQGDWYNASELAIDDLDGGWAKLTPKMKSAVRRYFTAGFPKAFAASPSGAYGWGRSTHSGEHAERTALNNCCRWSRLCKVVLIDHYLVDPDEVEAADLRCD